MVSAGPILPTGAELAWWRLLPGQSSLPCSVRVWSAPCEGPIPAACLFLLQAVCIFILNFCELSLKSLDQNLCF